MSAHFSTSTTRIAAGIARYLIVNDYDCSTAVGLDRTGFHHINMRPVYRAL